MENEASSHFSSLWNIENVLNYSIEKIIIWTESHISILYVFHHLDVFVDKKNQVCTTIIFEDAFGNIGPGRIRPSPVQVKSRLNMTMPQRAI